MKIHIKYENAPRAFEYGIDAMTNTFDGNVVLGLHVKNYEANVGPVKLQITPVEALDIITKLSAALTGLKVGQKQ